MDIMKLVKLLYLSDRTSLERYGYSMTGDRMVSMPYGPVLSSTYSVMNGDGPRIPGGWECWISDRAGHRLALQPECEPTEDALDELSPADMQVMESVCEEFGRYSALELSDYTHKHCPEWENPRGSSYPISYETLFRAVGKSEDEAKSLAESAKEIDKIDLMFSRL